MEEIRKKTIGLNRSGKVRPVVLGLIVIISGLAFGREWWVWGIVILIAVFIEAAIRYSQMNVD